MKQKYVEKLIIVKLILKSEIRQNRIYRKLKMLITEDKINTHKCINSMKSY